MQAECPHCGSWSREKIILRAQCEKERIAFYQPYGESYFEACRSVVENSPSFDRQWKEAFPDPAAYREMVRAQETEERRAKSPNSENAPCDHRFALHKGHVTCIVCKAIYPCAV